MMDCYSDMVRERSARSVNLGVSQSANFGSFDEWSLKALNTVKKRALQTGFSREDAEDCSMDFVVRHLTKRVAVGIDSWQPPRCLGLSARNHVIDRWRSEFRRRSHRMELRLPSYSEDQDFPAWDPVDPAPGPEALFSKSDCLERMDDAISLLSPGDRTLIIRFHIDCDPIPDIAADMGKSVHAVEQRLYRARRRLQAILNRDGWNVNELQYCLCPAPTTVHN